MFQNISYISRLSEFLVIFLILTVFFKCWPFQEIEIIFQNKSTSDRL